MAQGRQRIDTMHSYSARMAAARRHVFFVNSVYCLATEVALLAHQVAHVFTVLEESEEAVVE